MQFGFGFGLTPVVRKLLIVNVGVFVLQMFTKPLGDPITRLFALQPNFVITHFAIWQLFTYMFLHGGIFHIFFNMFALWMFGCEVERTIGSREFLRFYILCGIGAGLCHFFFNWNSVVPVIGASGAIYGVLVAFAVLFPNRIVTLLLFFVLPVNIKAKYLVAIFVGISLLLGVQSQLFGISDHVAHLAHLGGAAVGFLLLKKNDVMLDVARRISRRQELKRAMIERHREEDIRQKRQEVDKILDKINQVGFDNISDKEKKLLKEFSEFLSRN
jgi:membrane associated rhomboid family serine protease